MAHLTVVGSVVCFVVMRSSCRSIMLRQVELAFFKAISTLQLSPAILKELRMALCRRKKKSAVPAGSRSTATGGGAGAPQRTSGELAGKRKANDWKARATRPSQQTGAQRLVKGPRLCPRVNRQSQQAASCSRQLGPPEGGSTYAFVLAGSFVPFQQVGRSSPQPWIQTRLNPRSLRRQSIGACLVT